MNWNGGLDDAMVSYIKNAKKAAETAENDWQRDRAFVNSIRAQVEANIPVIYKKR